MTASPSARLRTRHLGEFSLRPRVLLIIAWALPIGAAGTGAAWVLLWLIGLITNLIGFRYSMRSASFAAWPPEPK